MKNRFLLFAIALLFSFNAVQAQCVTCVPDPSLFSGVDDYYYGLTPDSITVQAGEDTTIVFQFVLPKLYDYNGIDANVTAVTILDVTDLPLPLNSFCWKSDQDLNNNQYNPQSNRYGCVTMSINTLAAAGTYPVNVSVEGTGSVAGISQTVGLNLPLFVTVLPPAGNPYFASTAYTGCDSLDFTLSSTYSTADTIISPIEYVWDFGDGSPTETGSSVSHSYSAPGTYIVSETINIYELYISDVSATVHGSWYAGTGDDGGVFGIGASDADIEGSISNGNTTQNLSEVGDDNTPSWSGIDLVVTDYATGISFQDNDLIGSDDGGSYTFTINGPGVFSFGSGSNNMSGNVTVQQRIASTQTVYDTIIVYPSPSAPLVSFSYGDSIICQGDSAILMAASSYSYQWYQDSVMLSGETNQTLTVYDAGVYSVSVADSGIFCTSDQTYTQIYIDNVVAPVILPSTTGGFYVENVNDYDVQWYANGSGSAIPIPNATADTLPAYNPNNAPFTVTFVSTNGCEVFSAPFSVCEAGSAVASATEVTLGNPVTVEAENFILKSGNAVAWAISTEADGPVVDAASLQAAIDADLVFPSDSNTYTLDCNSLPAGVSNGNYYITPFAAEAIVADSVLWNPAVDSGCVPDAEFCLDITGTDWGILTSTLNFTFPDGSVVNIINELVPANLQSIIPDTIDESLLALLPSVLPGGLCFQLSDLYDGDPNGTWTVSAQNVGTGDLTVQVFDFVATVYADSCSLITQDEVTNIPGQTGTITAGSSGSISFLIPPISASFPSVAADCDVIGDAVLLTIDCSTDIDEVLDVASLNLYPNPNEGTFKVSLDVKERTALSMQIVDVTGRVILNQKYPSVEGHFSETFDLRNNLSSGFYVLNLEIEGNSVQKHFIVK